MDIIILLLFMAIFYIGPELLKRYRTKENIQPPITENLNSEATTASPQIKQTPNIASATGVQPTMASGKLQSVSAIVEEQSAWQGRVDQNMVINGVIFAEILQPPRAYRPFVRR